MVECYELAAAGGSLAAITNLGTMYLSKATGVEVDWKKGVSSTDS